MCCEKFSDVKLVNQGMCQGMLDAPFLTDRTRAYWLCPHSGFSEATVLLMWGWGGSPSSRATVLLDQSPTFVTSFTLDYLPRTLFSNEVLLWVGT